MSNTMQAVGFYKYGGAEVLEMLVLPRPQVQPNTVLLRVAAVGVNPADWVIRSGGLRFAIRPQFPFIPGNDVAGIVDSVGAGVTRFQVGDAVYAMTPNIGGGGYAEYALLAEKAVAHIPAGLTYTEAAAIPLAALTAFQALRDKAHLQAGTSLLINGASGGVGSFAVQIAKAMGAKVAAVCSERNIEMVRQLGADEVIDYTHHDIFQSEQRYNIIFDAVGLYGFTRWQKLLEKGGTIVTVHPLRGNPLFQQLARLTGKYLKMLLVEPSGDDLRALHQWIAAGQVRPVIERAYPLAEATAAQRHSETKRVRGKLVLIVDERLAQQPVQPQAVYA